jgi:hypothetical protein
MYSTCFPGGLQRGKKFLYGTGGKITDTDGRNALEIFCRFDLQT